MFSTCLGRNYNCCGMHMQRISSNSMVRFCTAQQENVLRLNSRYEALRQMFKSCVLQNVKRSRRLAREWHGLLLAQ